MELLIMQGWSGAGKSTYLKEVECLPEENIASMDHFFMDENGDYNFVGMFVPGAIAACMKKADELMAAGTERVAIDNTQTELAHMVPYIDMAYRYGYDVTIIIVRGEFKPKAPDYAVQRQKDLLAKFPYEDLVLMYPDVGVIEYFAPGNG